MIDKIKNLPSSAGVYQYFDRDGKLLYVGKAKNLKNRVKSYWRFTPSFHPNPNLSPRVVKMLHQVESLEYIIVDSEDDALILENSLIKQLKPKYNILLRDDKSYPYIYIDMSQEFPRFEITRRVLNSKSVIYYGPFPSGAKALLDSIYEIYPLVQRKSCIKSKSACLFYQIGRCLAPCEGRVSKDEYAKLISEVKEAIINKSIITDRLKSRMFEYAKDERFEEAGEIRDKIEAIDKLSISSSIDMANSFSADIFSIVDGGDRGVVVRVFIRAGRVVSSSYSYFYNSENFDKNEAYRQAILEFYTEDRPQVVKDILLADEFEDSQTIESFLSARYGKKIVISTPKRGDKRKLVELATKNAYELLKKSSKESEDIELLIKELFSLSVIPYRVESFDNSHLQGEATVGGMVVFDSSKWDKSSYRRYELHYKDEYSQMREMLSRRIKEFSTSSPPDLWILDGGYANLKLAISLLDEAGVNLDVIAIAKEKIDAKAHRAKGSAKDLIYTKDEIFELMPTDKRLQWVQRQRDEAHRYAITYHQNKKRKNDTEISLLNKKGIGVATVTKLINYFGSFAKIEEASYDEIKSVTNKKIADILKSDS
jgi:excinuclease ABC subunit C